RVRTAAQAATFLQPSTHSTSSSATSTNGRARSPSAPSLRGRSGRPSLPVINWLPCGLPCAGIQFSDPSCRYAFLSKSRCIAHGQRSLKSNKTVTFPIRTQTPARAMHYETLKPMKRTHAYIKIGLLLLGAAMFTVASARADTYSWTNFQSDIPGVAQHTDSNLVNPWGMAVGSSGTIWVSDNGTGVSTLYNQDGTTVPLVVKIPPSAQNTEGANPTGIVFNDTEFFQVTRNGTSAPAIFIFVSEDGSISGWNPTVEGTRAIKAVDNGNDAIYKGATLGVANGDNFLFVTDFHTGEVETYDDNFHRVNANGFVDPNLPNGYGPFGIRNFNGEIFVTYAKQDADREDDVACPGCGLVNVFDTSGNFLRRLAQRGNLNAPWGLAEVDGELWVGNFGDGKIN